MNYNVKVYENLQQFKANDPRSYEQVRSAYVLPYPDEEIKVFASVYDYGMYSLTDGIYSDAVRSDELYKFIDIERLGLSLVNKFDNALFITNEQKVVSGILY